MKNLLSKMHLLLVLIALLSSCKKEVKIGFLLADTETERWNKDKELFIQKAEDLGANVIVKIADGDPEIQNAQADQLLNEKTDVLVIVPANLYQAATIVEKAHKKKVPVLSYDRLIRNCDLDFYVSFDNVDVGRLQAEYMIKSMPAGNYALVGGPTSDNNSFLLRLGQLSALQPYVDRSEINIIYDQYVNDWSEEEGYVHMKNILGLTPDINAVILANDLLATGAAKAIEEAGLTGKVLIGGQDADLDACQRIVGGSQTMTIYKPIEAIASTAAEIAVKMANGKISDEIRPTTNNGKTMVPSVLLPSMVVNKSTIQLTVIADGYLKENNIYQ